jgi:Ca2+-binding EF-hand superfamily protein
MIDFDEKERSKLRQYFKSLDEDGSGSIGMDELEDPLISMGIAETREEVKKIIDSVDDDKSG